MYVILLLLLYYYFIYFMYVVSCFCVLCVYFLVQIL
jgi:hypothetical protein